MQTRLRLINVNGLAPMPKGTVPNQPDKPCFYAHLLTFVPVEAPADGTPTGDIHVAGVNQPISFILQGGQYDNLKIGSEYLCTIELAGK